MDPFPNHKHHGLYSVKKERFSSNFGGEALVSLKMTNKLPFGNYTLLFESFSAIINSSFTHVNDEVLNSQVFGHNGIRIITFDHDYQTTFSKSIIQFYTDGNTGDITFQIQSYGTNYNNPDLYFLFYSRVVSGKQSLAFNHNLFDVNDVQLQNQILYFEDVNLNGNMISGLGDPQNDTDAANKKYVDTEITKVNIDASPLLPRDGSRSMFGDLTLGNNYLINVNNVDDHQIDDSYSVIVRDLRSVVNKGYLNANFFKINGNDFDLRQKIITNCEPYYDGMFDDNSLVSKAFVDAEISKLPKPATDVLKLDGSKAMTGDLDMNNNSIINLKDPTTQSHGANKKYVDDEIAKIPSQPQNVLKLDGSKAMTGDLDMNNNSIINLKDPKSWSQ